MKWKCVGGNSKREAIVVAGSIAATHICISGVHIRGLNRVITQASHRLKQAS